MYEQSRGETSRERIDRLFSDEEIASIAQHDIDYPDVAKRSPQRRDPHHVIPRLQALPEADRPAFWHRVEAMANKLREGKQATKTESYYSWAPDYYPALQELQEMEAAGHRGEYRAPRLSAAQLTMLAELKHDPQLRRTIESSMHEDHEQQVQIKRHVELERQRSEKRRDEWQEQNEALHRLAEKLIQQATDGGYDGYRLSELETFFRTTLSRLEEL